MVIMAVGSVRMMGIAPIREFSALQVPSTFTRILVLGTGVLGSVLIEAVYQIRRRHLKAVGIERHAPDKVE